MRWADERYVRVYTRDTGEWLALGWEAQALFLFALRKADRAGIVHTGKAGPRGLAGMTGMPLEVVTRALPLLFEDGCFRECDGGYIIPNFIAAQEVPISDAQRKRDQRERDRAKALAAGGPSTPMAADIVAAMKRAAVTPDGHAMESRVLSRKEVTLGHAGEVTPSRAVPCLAEPFPASQEPQAAPIPVLVEPHQQPATGVPSNGPGSPAIARNGVDPSRPSAPFRLEAQKPARAARKTRAPSAAERLYESLEKMREERCAEVGEPFVKGNWPFHRINTQLKPLTAENEEAQALFAEAWGEYLADVENQKRETAWSLAFFLHPGVRSKYETMVQRSRQNEALEGA